MNMGIGTYIDAQAQVGSNPGDTAIDRRDELELLNFKALKALIGLSRTTVWRLEKRGEFPARVMVGRRVAWRRTEVYRWIYARPTFRGLETETDACRA